MGYEPYHIRNTPYDKGYGTKPRHYEADLGILISVHSHKPQDKKGDCGNIHKDKGSHDYYQQYPAEHKPHKCHNVPPKCYMPDLPEAPSTYTYA